VTFRLCEDSAGVGPPRRWCRGLPSEVAETLAEVAMIEVGSDYWQRAGILRAKVLAKRRRARLGDALIAQSCIDQGIPLITRDRDFCTFAQAAGLGLVLGSGRN